MSMVAPAELLGQPSPARRRRLGFFRASIWLSAAAVGVLIWRIGPELIELPYAAPLAADPPSAERPAWTSVNRPLEAFSLDIPDIPREQRRYEARRHVNGVGRDDIVTLGVFEGSGPYARVSLYRPGPEAAADETLFLDLARRAAGAGLAVERAAVSTAMDSKFGPVEVSDILLEGGGAGRACLAFRYLSEDPALHIGGWSCGGAGRPVDRVQLACQLDRLNLLSDAGEKPLRTLFLQAERRRDPACSRTRLTAAGRKPGWLDPDTPAQLREASR